MKVIQTVSWQLWVRDSLLSQTGQRRPIWISILCWIVLKHTFCSVPRWVSRISRKHCIQLHPRIANKMWNLISKGVLLFTRSLLTMTVNTQYRHQWRVAMYSAEIHHHSWASNYSCLNVRCLVFLDPRSSVNIASEPERTYIPCVPMSVCCSQGLSYTPKYSQEKKTSFLKFGIQDNFFQPHSLPVWIVIDPSTSAS